MSKSRKVSFIIGANVSNFTKGLNKAQRKFQRFNDRMNRMGSNMTQTITAPLAAFGGLSLKASADFERIEQSLSILNKSAEKGAKIFNDLKNLSAGTPFQVNDLAKAQQTLQGFSMSADQAFESIQMLGDISAVTGGDLQSIAVAYGQSRAEGKLFTRDIRQFINQGVPAVKLLAESMGVAENQIFDLAEQGKISFADLQKAFKKATSEGEMFANGMRKQSNTLHGIFSTLWDNINIALGEIGDSLVETFDLKDTLKRVISFIQRVVNGFKNLSEETKKRIFVIAGLLGAAGPLALAIGALGTIIATLMSPVALVIGAIAGIVTVGNWVYSNWEIIAANLKVLWGKIKAFTAELVESSLQFFADMFKNLLGWMSTLASALGHGILGAALVGASALVESGMNTISDATQRTREELEKNKIAAEKAAEGYVTLGQSLKNLGNSAFNAFSNLTGFSLSGSGGSNKSENPLTTSSIAGERFFTKQGLSDKFSRTFETINKGANEVKAKVLDLSNALQTVVNQAFVEFGETLGNIFTGDAGAKGFFNNILLLVADFASQLGKIMIGIGTASLALKTAFSNPFAAIAAGTALIALSTVAKNLLKDGPQGQKMAEGGIVPDGFNNDTYPALLSSGEMVVPKAHSLPDFSGASNVNVSGEFRVRGTDLVVVLEKARNSTLR